ncbi:ABC transporter permease subunit [Nocardia zapadnayensis]|uniref:ABC transporter permease n=1 Tax=Nocardia rhamnosiphila TaxID=426716 RepID=UPI0022483BA9|nr:ABC transporter permease subunit [Nocardia zapadnayensis]MCX0275116.1 ABC transporter permease subunit [Nocardia zapadnayensis]
MTTTTTPGKHHSHRRRLPGRPKSFDTVALLIAAVLILLVSVPLLQVAVDIFWQDGSVGLGALEDTLAIPDLGGLMIDTVVVVAASSVLAVVIGTLIAWANERTDARMGLLNDVLPYLPFLLPPIAGAVGWTMLLSPKAGLINAWLRDGLGALGIHLDSGPFDINTWYGLVMVYTIYAVPYVYMNVSAALTTFDSSLEEASRLSGAGYLRTLRRVTIPALAPSIGAGFLLCTWFGFGMFSIAAIIGTPADIDVIAVRIVHLLTFSYPPEEDLALGLSAIVMLFVGLSYYVQYRVLKNSRFSSIAGKSTTHRVTRLGRWRPVVRGCVLLYVILSTVLPMVGLFLVALNGYWTPKIKWESLGFDAFRTALFEDPKTQHAFTNSLGLGLIGGLIGIVAAAIVSIYVAQRRNKATQTLDAAIKLPASISHMVIAVGILLLLGGSPFYLGGTWLILLLGYLAIYLPQASIATDAAVAVVGRELAEASKISGGREWKTFLRVYAPLMLPGLVAGWALLFIRIVGDLTASAILSGTNNVVLGFRILEVFNGGSYATLAALSAVLVLVTGAVLLLVISTSKRLGIAKSRTGN